MPIARAMHLASWIYGSDMCSFFSRLNLSRFRYIRKCHIRLCITTCFCVIIVYYQSSRLLCESKPWIGYSDVNLASFLRPFHVWLFGIGKRNERKKRSTTSSPMQARVHKSIGSPHWHNTSMKISSKLMSNLWKEAFQKKSSPPSERTFKSILYSET